MASPDLTSAAPVGGDAPQQVAYETLDEGRIARIWLNRPEAQNAQSRTLLVQLDEAFGRVSEQQVERYREAVKELGSLTDLVQIARRLHAEDLESGATTTVTQMMAAASDPERGGALLDRFDLWIGLVQEALERAAAQYPIAAVVPPREAAYAICSMFLGIELMSRLDPERSEAEPVFDMMQTAAGLVEQFAPTMSALEGGTP